MPLLLSSLALLACVLQACTTSSAPLAGAPSETAHTDEVFVFPTSHAECRASSGEVEPERRGGRCFSYYTPRRDVAAYARCRDLGGVPHVVGPGRRVSGQSHVCTLVFEPER